MQIIVKKHLAMNIHALKNEDDYNLALRRIDELIDYKGDSIEEMELEDISQLVWDYEEKLNIFSKLS